MSLVGSNCNDEKVVGDGVVYVSCGGDVLTKMEGSLEGLIAKARSLTRHGR